MDKISVIRLGCVGCGAALEIGQDVNQLACGHCGTSQVVQREGGAIHLKELAHTLSRVQAGTDKTAAELAIARLTQERDQTTVHRQKYVNERTIHRHNRIRFWRTAIDNKYYELLIVFILGMFIGGVFILGTGAALFGLKQGGTSTDVVLFLSVLGAIVGGAIAYKLDLRLTGRTPSEMRRDWEQEIGALDADLQATQIAYEKRMREYGERIQKYRQIADS